MSPLPAFEHVRPRTLEEALAALDGDALPYHGGTELFAVMRLGLVRPPRLVDLKGVAELRGIRRVGHDVVIGAGTTHREVATDDTVRRDAPLLREVSQLVGNVRVRSTGTVGGNLCFAEPKSDLATALIALGADLVLRLHDGERTVALSEFLLGPYVADLQPGELLTAVRVPAGAASRCAYRKLQTAEWPTVGVAAVAPGVTVPRYRVVVGAVAEVPAVVEADALDDFDPAAIAEDLDVIADLSGAEDYKRHVTAVTVARTLADLAAREAV